MTINTALMGALEHIFVDQRLTFSEYNLIGILQEEPYSLFSPEAMGDPLTLFRCHFVLFHHLYTLQGTCLKQGKGMLNIHTTGIALSAMPSTDSDTRLEITDPLRLYYLDWTHFDETHKEDVDALLNSFWKRMQRESPVTKEERKRALACFSLSEPFNLKQLKVQYLNLQHQYHPDKGGSAEQSQTVQQAYRVLKKVLAENH